MMNYVTGNMATIEGKTLETHSDLLGPIDRPAMTMRPGALAESRQKPLNGE